MKLFNIFILILIASLFSVQTLAAEAADRMDTEKIAMEEPEAKGLDARQVCSCVCGRNEKHNLKLVDNCKRTYGGKACRLERGVDSTYNITTCKKIYVTN